jgi:hypothetical protein
VVGGGGSVEWGGGLWGGFVLVMEGVGRGRPPPRRRAHRDTDYRDTTY